jgi:pimeloyl-ACP methyl ester carboxylesterase
MSQRLLLLLVVALLPSACVGNRSYRGATEVRYEQLTTRQFDPTQVNSDEVWPYRLTFVEFDDRGEMFARSQLTTALQEIAKAKAEAAAKGVKPVVVVFVHGWKNNASESSGNVWGFRQMLAGLSLQYNRAPVVGVYIGWRGAVISAPILKEFTFFDRRRKSQNLPNAHMVEALLKIMQQTKGVNFDDSAISLLIGHSFGGAVLETALTETLLGMVVKAGATGPMRWPATAIVFINEAQQASRSYQLIEALHENLPSRDGRDSCLPSQARAVSEQEANQIPEPPAIISISSTGDYATRALYPATQAILRPFNSLRHYQKDQPNFLGFDSQTPMFFNTTAHMRSFQSHLMGPADDPDVAAAEMLCKPFVRTTVDGIPYSIVERPEARNRTPYWVMHTPASIVPDHSTIFTPAFTSLLITFIFNVTGP